ncbi:DUF1249 domain-containing protein [Aquisalimonas sp.]|uniref:DUF1249 domain-containing protein n=2 Tax=unclassified Aquisalimonas TaxID=2644645 RepID=UPI0025BFD533|nr:DUF1249 domain-containing protein [Aquisalimonas sp.]
MFSDARQHSLLDTLPSRSFVTLMELYEDNYILVRRLVPGLQDLDGAYVSRVSGTADLHLRVLEQTPYTTSLSLTHVFRRPDAAAAQPDLQLRIYHDARAGEVLPETDVTHFDLWGGRQPERKSLEWRWELNRFLNRWLRYCLNEGHGFSPAYAPAETG